MRGFALPALAAVIAAGCLDSAAPQTPGGGGAAFAGHAAGCRRPATYRPAASPRRPAPGELVRLAGTFPLYGEDGRPGAATTRIAVWWNLRAARWTSVLARAPRPAPARPGPAVRVLVSRVPVPSPCTCRLAFRAPRAAAGGYPVVIVYFAGGSAAALPAARLTLRPS